MIIIYSFFFVFFVCFICFCFVFFFNLLRAAGEIRILSTLLHLCFYRIFYLLSKNKQQKNNRQKHLIMMIIAFFSVAPAQNRTSECPLHYNLVGDDCYFVSSIKLTWKEAKEVCKRESNGDLISVHSPVEQGKIVTGQNKLY